MNVEQMQRLSKALEGIRAITKDASKLSPELWNEINLAADRALSDISGRMSPSTAEECVKETEEVELDIRSKFCELTHSILSINQRCPQCKEIPREK